MAANDDQMVDTGPTVSPQPVLPEPGPTAPQPDATPVTPSDYGGLRGSAAAVDPSTQSAVAPKGKAKGPRLNAAGAERRGASTGVTGEKRNRSRSEERRAAELTAGVSTHVQLLQAQVNQITERLTKLESEQLAGRGAIASFADKLVM